MPQVAFERGGAAHSKSVVPSGNVGRFQLSGRLPRRSKADFISKLSIVLEEADESCYWMEILVETEIVKAKLLGPLLTEANELVAIFVASLKTARG